MSHQNDSREDGLDHALRVAFVAAPADDAAATRVMGKLHSLPPQKAGRFAAWPRLFLNWEFAPAWPRLAALACSIVLGFAVGLTGLDRHLQRGAPYTVASALDFTAAMSEPEPLTGLRP